MCKPSGYYSRAQQLLYISGGPFASLVLTLVTYVLLAWTEGDSAGRWLLGMVMVFSGYSFLVSIIPFRLGKAYGPGRGNDMWMILQLLKTKKLPAAMGEIGPLVDAGKLTEAITVFETLVAHQKTSPTINRTGVWLYLLAHDYERAAFYNASLSAEAPYETSDYINAGYLQMMTGNQGQAVEHFEKALVIEPDNLTALTNISYSLIVLERYPEAIEYASRAIITDPLCAGALDNRGLARLQMGLLEAGRADIEAAIGIDPSQPELYRNLGIYHLLKLQYAEALVLFEKAKGMDSNTADIDAYIAQVHHHLLQLINKDGQHTSAL